MRVCRRSKRFLNLHGVHQNQGPQLDVCMSFKHVDMDGSTISHWSCCCFHVIHLNIGQTWKSSFNILWHWCNVLWLRSLSIVEVQVFSRTGYLNLCSTLMMPCSLLVSWLPEPACAISIGIKTRLGFFPSQSWHRKFIQHQIWGRISSVHATMVSRYLPNSS